MTKPYSKKAVIKLLVDIGAILLYPLQLSHFFMDQSFHQITGILFMALMLAHNLLNIGWYQAIGKGRYSPKRVAAVIVNLALLVDIAGLLITGIYLNGIGQLHGILASAGLVLMAVHILLHGLAHGRKKHRSG